MTTQQNKQTPAVCPKCGGILLQMEAGYAYAPWNVSLVKRNTSAEAVYKWIDGIYQWFIDHKTERHYVPNSIRICCSQCASAWKSVQDMLEGADSDEAMSVFDWTNYPIDFPQTMLLDEEAFDAVSEDLDKDRLPCGHRYSTLINSYGLCCRVIDKEAFLEDIRFDNHGSELISDKYDEFFLPYPQLAGGWWFSCGQCNTRWSSCSELIDALAQSPIIVAHIADSHLRQMQYNSSKRGAAFASGLSNAVTKAYEMGADIIVHAGDLLDTSRPSVHDMLYLKDLHMDLIARGLPMICISGNHDDIAAITDDFTSKRSWMSMFQPEEVDGVLCGIIDLSASRYRSWLSDDEYELPGGMWVRMPKSPDHGLPQIHKVQVRYDRSFTVAAYPWCKRADMTHLLTILDHMDVKFHDAMVKESYTDKSVDMVMWHGAVQELCNFPMETALTLDDFKLGVTNVYALGDIHIHTSAKLQDGTYVTYSGSTCMCKSDEEKDKKMWLYELHKGGGFKMESVPFDTAPILTFTIRTAEDAETALRTMEKDMTSEHVYQLQIHPEVGEKCLRQLELAARGAIGTVRLIMLPPENEELAVKRAVGADITLEEFTPRYLNSKLNMTNEVTELCASLVNQDIDPDNIIQTVTNA